MPTVWADGGESLCAPENTLPAYWGALGAGAGGLALTVQCSKDGRLICSAADRLGEAKGGGKPIGALSGAEIRKFDAGARFRSQAVDERFRAKGRPGRETPWAGHAGKHDALYHPELDEVLRHFGRRTRLLIRLKAAGGSAPERARLAELTLGVLDRHAVFGRTLLAGDARTIAALADAPAERCLLAEDVAPAEAVKQASRAKASAVVVTIATVRDAERLPASEVKIIARPAAQCFAFEPALYRALAGRPGLAGCLVRGVTEMQAVAHRHGMVVQDSFAGQRIDADLWTLGHSRNNHDTKIRVDDGLRIDIEGEEYSGAAAFSNFSINGDFDARMSFEVANPEQGTTFELAALHVDAGYRPTNLTFDVHGAPPYASSERDENDGFRIGWNNGPALTRWVDNEPQSSNLYNCYGRDVGLAGADSPVGRLRLTRHGQIFNAYYTDRANEGWILSGSVPVPALADAVFLRLGAKHWPKGGRVPPTNHFRFTGFELRQWD
jgi:hypothetical protein